MRTPLAVAFGLLFCLTSPVLAHAAPTPATLPDVLSALDIQPREADYVIVVDTSLSMQAEERYTRVLDALNTTLEQLQPDDFVALISFDDGARLAYEGPRGTDPQEVLETLPAEPLGEQTDIGAGIELGLTQLERPDAKAAGALVLITDGGLDTRPESPFAEPTSPGWDDLRQRAAALSSRDLATYALALDADTDAALMTDVFPETEEIPVGGFAEVLSDLQAELLVFQAQQDIDEDLAAGAVTARFVNTTQLGAGTHNLTLQLTSTFSHLPTYVMDLAVRGSGPAEATAEGLPSELELAPGQTVRLPVTLTVDEWDGTETVLSAAGTVDSPWGDVIRTELRRPFLIEMDRARLTLIDDPAPAPAPTQSADEEPAAPAETSGGDTASGKSQSPAETPTTGQRNLAPVLIGSGAAALLALVAGLVYLSRAKLDGTLTVLRNGEVVNELLLTGRSVALQPAPMSGGPTGTVSALARRRGVVQVKASAEGSEQVRAVLSDGETAQIGSYEVRYISTRSRVLAQLG